ncbi:MAG: hypothetical protein HY859_05370 [Caulobacterales bacterium]|nr:hypothetical protein [Caulobacterales bacterium]
MVAIACASPHSGGRPPSPERLEWLKIKAEVERETRAARRAARQAAASKPPPKDRSPSCRARQEARLALYEHWRNKRRWEEN